MATIQRSTDASSLAEVVGRILDKGIVVDAWARVSLIVIELLAIKDRVVMPPIAKLFSAPWRGLIWVAHELHTAANRERSAEEDELMQSLYALLLRHERDKIGESQFAAGEAVLLERIDLLKLRWPYGPRRCRHRYGSASPTSSTAYV